MYSGFQTDFEVIRSKSDKQFIDMPSDGTKVSQLNMRRKSTSSMHQESQTELDRLYANISLSYTLLQGIRISLRCSPLRLEWYHPMAPSLRLPTTSFSINQLLLCLQLAKLKSGVARFEPGLKLKRRDIKAIFNFWPSLIVISQIIRFYSVPLDKEFIMIPISSSRNT